MLNSHSVLKKIYPLLLNNHIILNKPTIDYSFNFYFINIFYSQSFCIITSDPQLWIYKLKIFINIQTKQTNLITYLKKICNFDVIYELKKFKTFYYLINDNKNIINIYLKTKNKFNSIKEIYFLSTYSQFYQIFLNKSSAQVQSFQMDENFKNFSHTTLTGFIDNLVLEKFLRIKIINFKKAFIFNFIRVSTLYFEIYIKYKSYYIFILLFLLGIKICKIKYYVDYSIDKMRNIEYVQNNFNEHLYLKDHIFSYKSKFNLKPYFYLKYSNYFPSIKLIELISHLHNYSLISYQYIFFLKYYKIYRICQRKENLNKKGYLKILHII